MKWTEILGANTAAIIDSIGKLIDEYIFTGQEKKELKHEKDKLKNDITKKLLENNGKLIEEGVKFESEITKRHGQDMTSDVWLSKNIRPLCLIYILILYTFFSATKNVAGIDAIQPFTMVVIGFYFGGRSFEKISAFMGKPKKT